MVARGGRGGLGRGTTYSVLLHLGVLLALIVVIPTASPPAPAPEETMAVEFVHEGADTGKLASAQSDTHDETPPANVAPTKQPIQAPPAPPPPPPPPPAASVTKLVDTAKLPPPPPSEVAEALKPPPPARAPPSKEPPTDAKPVDSETHQPNKTTNPAVDTSSLQNTLEKFLTIAKADKPPKSVVNPSASSPRHGENVTGVLNPGQRKAIGDEVRRCYSEDTAAKDYASYSADIEVTVDGTGVVREVKLMPDSARRAASDFAYRAFAERAQDAVMDPQCARLPLPPNLLGTTQKLSFRFRP
jgi:outer membrane biosynthesis protein TonB